MREAVARFCGTVGVPWCVSLQNLATDRGPALLAVVEAVQHLVGGELGEALHLVFALPGGFLYSQDGKEKGSPLGGNPDQD